MLTRLDLVGGQQIIFQFAGKKVTARSGDTIASALLAAGIEHFRDAAVSGQARAPYCMMGVCFECLVSVDGRMHRQACLVPVVEGMRVEREG